MRLFSCLIGIIILLVLIDLLFGAVSLSFSDLFHTLFGNPPSELLQNIILGYRLPKMLTALLVGMALPTCGLIMQRFFRNPLAGPFVLGVSSGATLGAAIAILIGGLGGFTTALSVAGAATLGAMLVLLLIFFAALRLKGQNTILIFGILLSAVAFGVVNSLQYISNEHTLKLFVVWTMGSLSEVTNHSLALLALATFVGIAIVWVCLRPLALLQLGSEHATSVGLPIRTTTALLFVATALLAGVTTAFCGPIGFVGLVIPHLARILLRSAALPTLLCATLLLGMAAMLSVDILSQLVAHWVALPLNALIAVVNLPLLVHLLLSTKRVEV